jgi:hypothetical protein
MSKKSNVHPDYYTSGGRDRPDDAARARLNRAIAAKATSQQRPDRMGKDFYFERPDPAREPGFEAPAAARPKAKKKAAARAGAARKKAPRKTARPKTARAKKAVAGARKTRANQAKRTRKAAARPAKKR